jgi:hypothetical protein
MAIFMIRTLRPRHRPRNRLWLYGALVLAGFTPVVGCANEKAMQASASSLESLIEKLRQSKAFDQAAVEAALGKKLMPTSQNSSFAFFEAKDVTVGAHKLSLADYRSPISASATAGPLLNLMVSGPCLKKSAVQAKYGPLSVTNAPSGRSPDEELGLSRSEPWGTLSFGFAERNPDCLSSITFAVGGRGAL